MLLASSQVGAMRPLEGEQWLKKESLLLQSVQRGPVTGSVLLFVTIIIASSQVGAMRPLEGAQWLKTERLLLQSVQRGPVTGSGPNPCTNIPGRNKGNCP
ncbi:hypothetical protein CMV_029743 [Castanea mollissima]|uniref:Uncharacterized protein n=1 Tax=Castanea mollissima TaxID=60419 RepID=A0A8J4UZG5_9ROSI|nr:hypothetical protein CMV_029743 [Castanea mollissima]